MPVKFRCQHCKKLLGISSRKIGQVVDCPGCGRSVKVPSEDGVARAAPAPEFNMNDPAIVLALDELASITKQPQSALRPTGKPEPKDDDDGWLEPETLDPAGAPAPPPPAPIRDSTPTSFSRHEPLPASMPPPMALAPVSRPEAKPLPPVAPVIKELPPVPPPKPLDPPEPVQGTVFPAPPVPEAPRRPSPPRDDPRKDPERNVATRETGPSTDYSDHALDASVSEIAVTATNVGLPEPLPAQEGRRLGAMTESDKSAKPEVRYHYVSQPAKASPLPMAIAGAAGLLVGLGIGLFAGMSLRSSSPAPGPDKAVASKPVAPVPDPPSAATVTGRLKYRKQGNLKGDEGAVVLFLPVPRPEGDKLPSKGLRPGDSTDDRAQATQQLRGLRASLALVAADGTYSVSLPATGDYAVIAISANQPGDKDAPLSPFLQNILDSWFTDTHELLGERAVHCEQLPYDGMESVTWDFSFEGP